MPPPMKSSTYSSDYSHFLAELRSARTEAGVSQVQLAETLGQRQTYVSKCERGDRRLDVVELRAWVVALGGDPVGFMAGLEDRIARNARLPVHRAPSKKRPQRTGAG
jgi:transcriptional regulator with XRE-family HTH domain